MDLLLNPPLPNSPLNKLSPSSIFTPKLSVATRNSRTSYKLRVLGSKFHKSPSIAFYLPFSTAIRNVTVSAHFGGPKSRRRNSLRRKLLERQQVREKNPVSSSPSLEFQNPDFSFLDISDSRENLDSVDAKEGDFSYENGYGNELVELESDALEGLKPKSEKLGESVPLSKLENWVDQYKKDTAFWGVGSGPIFSVFHDLKGNVQRVAVNEEEILNRIRGKTGGFQDLTEMSSKILYARGLAREMERRGNVIPRNSSVAKFVGLGQESGFVSAVRGAIGHPEFFPVFSRVGRMVLFGFVAIWAVKKLLALWNKEERYDDLEKEKMRKKTKSGEDKEILEEVPVEVVQESLEKPMVWFEKPKLDKKELMRAISEVKASKHGLISTNASFYQSAKAQNFDDKIQKIRAMARDARELENEERSMAGQDGEENQLSSDELSSEMQELEVHTKEVLIPASGNERQESSQRKELDETMVKMSSEKPISADAKHLCKESSEEYMAMQAPSTSTVDVLEDAQRMVLGEVIHSSTSDSLDGELHKSSNSAIGMKPRIILSVKEAREFLAMKGDKNIKKREINTAQESTSEAQLPNIKTLGSSTRQGVPLDQTVHKPSTLDGRSDSLPVNACEGSIQKVSTKNENAKDSGPAHKLEKPQTSCNHAVNGNSKGRQDSCEDTAWKVSAKNENSKDSGEVHELEKPQTSCNQTINGNSTERQQSVKMESWMEKNFHEVEPIIEKMRDGFRDNYDSAREKVNQLANTSSDLKKFEYNEDDDELEWMKDDSLREIVFKVRDNELAGRDPFYLMDAEDKLKFFEGLERKVEKENEKLLQVHEYLHSNIENLDYGADGISVYDPPEKFIPRWKGPPVEKNPEFLNQFLEQRNAIFSGNAGISDPVKKDESKLIQRSTESQVNVSASSSLADNASKKVLQNEKPKYSKTVIQGSDGSVRPGKKSGKEYWQHTKKWSRGFLDSYNAETDPEVKSIMRNMGKDLDRWITEDEIQEAADLMTKLPERNKKFMEKKINKLKREMELFGPQAVVSKYSEYAEEKEEDYLWWLDLPHVLCIELYMTENEEQKIGFYSLEMATDLELDPKPCHVIAFEDAGDCKNICHIVQAHMDMLNNGHAFVVPRPPKDAFREAKANGFGVTVIRKGELQLNVDHTLEEVEEKITEIGSKMYHDMLMRERSVDINSLMKGVFGVNEQTNAIKRKRSKKRLKKPNKK